MDIIIRSSLPKLREKLLEALQAVLPIAAIVLVLCFSIAPVSPSILLCKSLPADNTPDPYADIPVFSTPTSDVLAKQGI